MKMRRSKFSSIVIILSFCSLLISGCKTPASYRAANDAADHNQHEIEKRQHQALNPEPPVVSLSSYYVDTKPIQIDQFSAWLRQPLRLQANGLPFDLLAQRIMRDVPMAVSFGADVSRSKPITMSYQGTVQGALDQLAAASGYAYTLEDHSLAWSALVTRTFNIAFMPGTSNYLVGQIAGGSATQTSSSGNVVTTSGNLDEQQYSNLQGRLSVWQDLARTLDNLKSPDGKVVISEATTSVTVNDHPPNVRAMATYITQLNKDLSRQVSLKVEVLEITLNDAFNYGINWNLAANEIVKNVDGHRWQVPVSLGGNLATSTNITNADENAGLASLQLGGATSNAIINALSQQGKLSVVTQPTVVTMNNQIAEIRITKDTGYLQSASTSSVVNGATTTTLTPGIVTDGFTLYLLPKIQNSSVYLQISSTLATLTALQNYNSETGTSSAPSSSSGGANFIQLPTLTEKHFNQRTVVQTGSTLVITGFKQLTDQTAKNSLFGVDQLGGKGANRKNVQTIVLITPTIISNQG